MKIDVTLLPDWRSRALTVTRDSHGDVRRLEHDHTWEWVHAAGGPTGVVTRRRSVLEVLPDGYLLTTLEEVHADTAGHDEAERDLQRHANQIAANGTACCGCDTTMASGVRMVAFFGAKVCERCLREAVAMLGEQNGA